jgi:hypothetical protein
VAFYPRMTGLRRGEVAGGPADIAA